jgi:HAD superfamily hydrolase (TIGR01509 family)
MARQRRPHEHRFMISTHGIDALIFDFDGTILDTESAEFEAWQQIYAAHGVALALADWVQGVGAINAFDPVAQLVRQTGSITVDAVALKARADAVMTPIIAARQPRPGVLALFAEARAASVKLAVASSSSHRWVDAHLDRLHLSHWFDHVCCRDDVDSGRAKPHPDIYLASLAALGVSATRAIAVEDSLNGLRAAKAAHIYAMVTPNPVTAGLDFTQADWVLPSLDSITLQLLSARFNARSS